MGQNNTLPDSTVRTEVVRKAAVPNGVELEL